MKRKTLKITAVCAALCLTVLAFAGCEKKTSTNSGDTIVWYMRKPVDNMTSYDVVMKEANKIIKDEIGAELELRFVESGMYDQKLNVMVSSGDKFDMCQLPSGTTLLNYVKDGAFIPVDDLLEKYGQDILSQQDPLVKGKGKYEGKTYGVQGQSALSVSRSFVFKKDLVEKYGFDYKSVKCLKDLEPYFKTLKENEPAVIPMFHGVVDVVNENWTNSAVSGIVFDEVNEKFVMIYDHKDVVEEARLKNDFYKKGYIASDAISRTDEMSEKKSGQYAVMNNNGYYSENGSKSSGVYGFPCVETYAGNTRVNLGIAGGVGISSTSKKPEKCMQLLNLIWKDDYLLNTLAYGVEGVNYTVNEERTKEIGSKSVNVKSGAEQTWAIWHNWLGPLFNQWDSAWNTIDVLENIKENNQKAKISGASGFVFNDDKMKAEIAKVTATYQSAYKIFDIGCMDDFDKYLENTRAEMKKSGVDTVIDEMNKQYKEWKNS